MDFAKLVSLIDTDQLFFSRADRLGDPFEGSWPRISLLSRRRMLASLKDDKAIVEVATHFGNFSRRLPKYIAVNCWHMNEHESAAMWRLYLKSNEGIAVQSTYENLRNSIIDDEKVMLGTVKYIDYDNEFIDTGNLLFPFVHKRKSFEHEREVRAVVWKMPVSETGIDLERETIDQGIKIKVDLKRLINKIYVAPSAPDWFAELVQAVIKRYGHGFEVVHSRLDEQPLF